MIDVRIAALAVCSVSSLCPGAEPAHHCQTLPPPKVLYVADSPKRVERALMLERKMSAQVTFVPLTYGDHEFHHMCDKPLEEKKADVRFVTQQGQRYVDRTLARADQFNVIVAEFQPRHRDAEAQKRRSAVQTRIVDAVRRGVNLVFINPSWETTFAGTPLADVLPVRFVKRKAWTTTCDGATDHPLVRGLALEVTGSHWYGPVYEPVDASCVPLSRNKGCRFWWRRVRGGGQVVHLYAALSGRWQWTRGNTSAIQAIDRPDDTTVWEHLFRRLLYGLTYGQRAFPVLTKIDLGKDAVARAGRALRVPVDVENRGDKPRTVRVVLTVQDRRGSAPVRLERGLTLRAAQRTQVVFEPTLNLPCTDSFVRLRARVMDKTGGAILSESTAWPAYVHRVPLVVKPDRPSYEPGQSIRVSVSTSAQAQPGAYRLDVHMVDRLGRAVASTGRAVRVTRGTPARWDVSMTMADWGPDLSAAYWVTALVSSGKGIVGLARAQVQSDRPWTMRDQFQFSCWTWGGDARRTALMHDAGFNALGYPGNSYVADRYGMRQYVESTGINTFGVTIDHDNWDAVREAMRTRMAKLQASRGPDTRSKALVSLGEESGFKGGWGRRYYWDGPQAPPLVQKVFDAYLAEQYKGDIARLNTEWGTAFRSFADVPLEKEKARAPNRVFVTAQAWAAMEKEPAKRATRIPVDPRKLDPKCTYIALTAPYYQTHHFFDWYYQRYCDLATEVYRTRCNPVPRTIMSAPGGFYPKVDVYNYAGQGPFYPKETGLVGNAVARRDYGDVPGFSAAMWAYFDLRSLWSCTVLSSVLAGNTHIDYWVDTPLTFNPDVTHTRASFWTKVLLRKLRRIEPVLLHRRFAYTKRLGLYIPDQPMAKGLTGRHFGSAISPNAPVYSALEKSGYMPRVVHARDFGSVNVLVACYAQVVSKADADALTAFVARGGLLIVTPWLGSCSPHGNVRTVYPAPETGLADLLGFKLLNTSQHVVKEDVPLDVGGHFPVRAGLTLRSHGRDRVLDAAADVRVLARYKDTTPLVLARSVGRGRVVYLNMVQDWNHWWNSFYEPPREAYRRLVDGIIRADGRVHAEHFVGFESAEAVRDNVGWWGMVMKDKPRVGDAVPWWATQVFTDPGGVVRYVGVFADHRSPKITARITWPGTPGRVLDLLDGGAVDVRDGTSRLTLRPGQAALWAVTSSVPDTLSLHPPARVPVGTTARVGVRLAGAVDPKAVHGVVLTVRGPDAHARTTRLEFRNVQVKQGRGVVDVPIALNDPVGPYTVVATECVTGLCAEGAFTVVGSRGASPVTVLCPFPKRESDGWPARPMRSAQFLSLLRRLRDVYLGTYQGLTAKYMLSYYLYVPFHPASRHALVRRLQRTPWHAHVNATADALRTGERFYLFPEDLNTDPDTGMRIDPLAEADPAAFMACLARVKGARRWQTTVGGVRMDHVGVGRGTLTVCHASVDRTAYTSADFIRWHEQVKNALRSNPSPSGPPARGR